jgi:hypothetical protein
MTTDSFGARELLMVDGATYDICCNRPGWR